MHGAIFHATCLATPLRDKLHGPLHRVIAVQWSKSLRDKLHQSLHKVELGSTFCNDWNNFFQRCIV